MDRYDHALKLNRQVPGVVAFISTVTALVFFLSLSLYG